MEGNTQLHQLELIARTVPCPDEIADQIIAAAQEGTFPDGFDIPEENVNARYRALVIFEHVASVRTRPPGYAPPRLPEKEERGEGVEGVGPLPCLVSGVTSVVGCPFVC